MADPQRSLFGSGGLPGFTKLPIQRDVILAAYEGSSMNPTLRQPELIEVIPYGGRRICPGDVIYFTRPGEPRAVVHRVVSIREHAIFTRGDNNPGTDEGSLIAAQVIGRVTAAWRGKRSRRILGGWRGLLQASTRHAWRKMDVRLSRIISPIYQWLASHRVISRFLPHWMRPRLISLQSDGKERLLLFWGKRYIGAFVDGQWYIRRPFRLIFSPTDRVGKPDPGKPGS